MRYIVESNGQSFITSNDMDSNNLKNEIENEVKLRNWSEYTVKEVVANVNE
jgi:hypothetical protein